MSPQVNPDKLLLHNSFRSSSKVLGQIPIQYVVNESANSTFNACEKSLIILTQNIATMEMQNNISRLIIISYSFLKNALILNIKCI